MKFAKKGSSFFAVILAVAFSCTVHAQENFATNDHQEIFIVQRNVMLKQYFTYIDSIVSVLNKEKSYQLTEHILVRNNEWIIDTLVSFDYYKKMEQGIFIYDQRELIVLHKGDTLRIPDSYAAAELLHRLQHTIIDVNIPEYKLRIIEYYSTKHIFSVRVGRNESKFLKTANRTVSLRTPIGSGEIVRIERNPIFINPASGERYYITKRDDRKYTRMPQIPWLEPMIAGLRQGALIHPTTNPETLGRAYSNGCVGTGEGDAWIIYYHAPVSTKVNFRYELEVLNEVGDTIRLKDIYELENRKQQMQPSSLEPAEQLDVVVFTSGSREHFNCH